MPGGGFGGGMPGGGFGGGFGGMRGGDRGGGGFNPVDMLTRFDRNNNKMIDPEEAEGPAKFFLERLAQSNPKIDLKRPVPLDVLTKEMEKLRGGPGAMEESSKGPAKPELLVPDFSLDSEPPTVQGFGSTSTMFNVKVEERDLKEAEERIRRYDRNNDGILSKEEIEGNRWSDDPCNLIATATARYRNPKWPSDMPNVVRTNSPLNPTLNKAVIEDAAGSCLAEWLAAVDQARWLKVAVGRSPRAPTHEKKKKKPRIDLAMPSRTA